MHVDDRKQRPKNELRLEHGKPLIFGENKEKGIAIDALSQFVVVAPQTSRGWAPDEVAAFVKFLQGRLSLDASRLYVTGHSMGGSGALHAATTGVFAACAALCRNQPVSMSQLRGQRRVDGVSTQVQRWRRRAARGREI